MNDAPTNDPDDEAPPRWAEAQLRAMMDRSDQDVAAGLTVPIDDMLTELDEIAASTEAGRRALPV